MEKGDPPIDIGWDDEDEDDTPPRELSPDEQALHLENMIRLRRFMRAYWIIKIGVTALIIAVVIRFFGR
ncbi:MAG: hypothetical protein HC777_01835 [Hyphomonadaceae bacterium]|nr:hypothetical protein [Hyphomonadaceae bacterium]